MPGQVLREAGWTHGDLPQSCCVYTPVGCNACHQGFRGRTGIFQVMPVSAALQALILQDVSGQALAQQAQREGLRSLRDAGLRKVLSGVTSLDEVLAATRSDA